MSDSETPTPTAKQSPNTLLNRFLDGIEKVGNKLPDPAVMFFGLLIIVAFVSWGLSYVDFAERHPVTGDAITITNLLASDQLTSFLTGMVNTFMTFAPLGVVLVAMLGVGVAERSGFINVGIKLMLRVTPKMLLTPMLILVAIVSHTAVDAGYVLVRRCYFLRSRTSSTSGYRSRICRCLRRL
jgi:aminobenzoyl-glutamate transport protein